MTPPDYLARTIVLDSVGYAPVSDSLTYPQLVGRLSGYLSWGGRHVLVAHSLGSLVSRGTYINYPDVRPNIAAIIAVAAPHQGAPLADNAVAAVNFFVDVQRRVNDGLGAANVTFEILSLFSIPSPGAHAFFATIASLVLWKTAGQDVDLGDVVNIPKVPALPDLSPSSSAIQMLNQRTDDAAIPRANIYGTIPFQNAAFRLKYSNEDKDADFSGAVTDRNRAVVIFKACKYFGYATIVLGGQARRCAYAAKVLQRVDERWTGYVNGRDGNGRPRYVPFDGIVPNERSHYPSPNGVAYEYNVIGVDHQNIYKTRAGLNQVAIAMDRIGMTPTGGGGGGGGVQTLASSISGPDVVNTDWYSTWSADVSGGTPPYTYSWSGLFYGTDSSVSGATSSSGDLIVDVYDAAGGHTTVTKSVTSTGCSGQYLC
ncbi:MAG: SprB repeat-containing protein [Gemmatimonadaceae bacterium]